MPRRRHLARILAFALNILVADFACAQDHTILFDTGAPGVSASMTNWGLDTCWANFDNMQRGLIFMGTNNVNIIRVGFFVDAPLVNNDVTAADKSIMQTDMNLAEMATAATQWDMNIDSVVDAWYQSGANTVYPDRWAAAIEACQRHYHRNIWSVEGFNEPDYTPNNEGSPQNLHSIFGYLRASTNFPGTLLSGGSTLDDDVAVSWFHAVSTDVSLGTTHCLAGTAGSYVNFIQTVAARGITPFNPELHNVCEAIMGVNYGLNGGIWWGTAERARGAFVNLCRGRRLGYADDLNNWTAAAVYRGTNGSVQAILGGSERMAATTTYRFFAQDRDVFYDGHGPQRACTVTVPGGNGYQINQPDAEQVVNINWGADVAPPVGGRYLIVNQNSGKVLELPGGGTNNGVQLDQNTCTGATDQQWDVYPLPNRFGGDISYYSLVNAKSRVTVDVTGGSYANGAAIQQWNGGTNVFEQWILQYTTNGYFKIRTRWCDKVMGVNGTSKNIGATISQWDDTGTPDQQWRLIPATVTNYDFTAPAAPMGVVTIVNPVSVQLNWSPNTEPDLAGYTVLRSPNHDGPYEIIARGLTVSTFLDKSANQSQDYYYVVQAVDRSLNTSGNSTPVLAHPTTGPALVARYNFDNNLRDSSGNGNQPIITNGSPAFVTGKFSSAVSLSGSGQYVMLPAGLLAGVNNFTVAAWVNWRGSNDWQRIFDFGNGTTQYMFLSPASGSGTLRFSITTNGSVAGAEQILDAPSLPVGQWEHVAVTLAGTSACLYTNGVVAASNTITIHPADFNPAMNYLGCSQYPADPPFNGSLDGLFIYNYALSDVEIGRLMRNLPPPPVAPTTLTATVAGNTVNFNWPASYVGCRLESNSVSLLATNSWFTVPGSASANVTSLPVNAVGSNVYFRLSYP